MSDVQPSNNNHGYRFRMFSKKFVSECGLDYSKLSEILEGTSGYIQYWVQLGVHALVGAEKASNLVRQECERNFNREMLNFLKRDYDYQNEININQNTKDFLQQLENVGDKSDDFWNNIKIILKIN